jgi:Peptidase propeptide and YPEB domain
MMKLLTIRSLLIALFALAWPAVAFGKDGDRGGDSSSGSGGGGNHGGDSGDDGGNDSDSNNGGSGGSSQHGGNSHDSDDDDGGNSGSGSNGNGSNSGGSNSGGSNSGGSGGSNVSGGAPGGGNAPNLNPPNTLMELLGLGNSEQNKAREEFKKGKIKKLSEVMAAVDKKYPGEIVSVKLKDDNRTPVYELKILSSDNRLRKIKVDARTLSIY